MVSIERTLNVLMTWQESHLGQVHHLNTFLKVFVFLSEMCVFSQSEMGQ